MMEQMKQKFQEAAPAADFWSFRLVDERMEIIQVRQDVLQPVTSVRDVGAMAAKRPTNGTWHLAHGEALAAAGQDGSTALSAAEERFQWALTFRMNAETLGQFAHAKVARGDYATARATATKATKPTSRYSR